MNLQGGKSEFNIIYACIECSLIIFQFDIDESLIEKFRKKLGKNEKPSVEIIDAQSIKPTLVRSGPVRA